MSRKMRKKKRNKLFQKKITELLKNYWLKMKNVDSENNNSSNRKKIKNSKMMSK